jgi:RTX calcium-binding nonapeptide repeat (4 copies)
MEMREQAPPSLRDRRGTLLSRLLLPLLAIGFVAAYALAGPGSAGVIRGSARADLLRGTAAADVLDGLAGDDRLFGYRGADRLHGGAGNDRLDGGADADRLFGDAGDDLVNGGTGNDLLAAGKGRDQLSGGPGDDVLYAQDGARDVLRCGAGRDTVHADRIDVVDTDCEIGRPRPPFIPPPPPPPPSGESVVLVDQAWTCSGPVNLDLVKVTMQVGRGDAIYLRTNCSGRIGRIEVETWVGDGVKVNAPEPAAHDLTIDGGYIRCHDHGPGVHQDGIQAMSGQRITFRNLEINCTSNPNGQLFINSANGGLPTDVVCDRCTLGSGAASTLLVGQSVRSGARRSFICPGRFHAIRINTTAESPVNTGNAILPDTDRRCQPAR